MKMSATLVLLVNTVREQELSHFQVANLETVTRDFTV